MGRRPKVVTSTNDLDRRELGYYSTPAFVAEFFARRMLELRPDIRRVLDPCIGRGEFTAPFKATGCHISGFDIEDMAPEGCDDFINDDFLKVSVSCDPSSLFREARRSSVDAIVANPPYNCHEVEYIRTHKIRLMERFGKSAALNMYSLFIRAIIDYADDGCIIGLVTHDSFLTATGHRELRQYILTNCVIHNLHLCPTNLFLDQGADVRTCLLILEKKRGGSRSVLISNRPQSSAEFREILHQKSFHSLDIDKILLNDARDSSEFTIGVPTEVRSLFNGRRLSEVAPCVTGISTGDDKKYIREAQSSEFAVPFYKNPASRSFFAKPDGYLCSNYEEVGRKVPNFIIRNKNLIFRGGISCSSMGVKFGATIRPGNSACGVNPNIVIDQEQSWWLLSFLNSRLCLYLTRGIIIRGNMITAGYASRIPVPEFDSDTMNRLTEFGQAGFQAAKAGDPIREIKLGIDRAIEDFLQLSKETVRLLAEFERDPIRLA